ncbi:MAG: DUF2141 domain-containing protein [Rhodospirillales bacterium]
MLRKIFIFMAALGCLPVWFSSASGDARLVIYIEGLRNDKGVVDVALFNKPDGFLDSDRRIAGGQVKISGDLAVIEIPGLEPGQYAAAFYHDENANGDFDQGVLGIPLEGYGFTNNVRVRFSAPGFEETAVTVQPGLNETRAKIRY